MTDKINNRLLSIVRNVEYDQPGAMLRDFSFVSKRKEACESVDHVYEIVDKGNQTCDDPKPNICELAQCPAYIPSTHDIPSDGDYATIEDTVGLGDRNVEECDDDIGIYATIPPH